MKTISMMLVLILLIIVLPITTAASSLYVDGIFNGDLDLGSGAQHFIMNFYGAEVTWGPVLLTGEYALGSQKNSDTGLRLIELKGGYRLILKGEQQFYLTASGLRIYGENDSFELDGILLGVDYVFSDSKYYYFSFSWDFIPVTDSNFHSGGTLISENEGLQCIKTRGSFSIIDNVNIGLGYRVYPTKDNIYRTNITLGLTYMF